jgi:DNA-binding NtrC family response regulator
MAKVLVVDDETQVRSLIRARLERAGYEVSEAADCESALATYRQSAADVVITDLVMPGERNGHELIRSLAEEFPDVRIVAISGAVDRDIHGLFAAARNEGAVCTLMKPFTSEQLFESVRAVLGE